MEEQEITLNERLECLQDELLWIKGEGGDISKISDGYHSFEELYEFRKAYNAALFNVLANDVYGGYGGSNLNPYGVHKSWRHNDGELCFGGGWFIVVATLPGGQISNHYKAGDWDLFQIPEEPTAKHPFDGHTGKDVIERLKSL